MDNYLLLMIDAFTSNNYEKFIHVRYNVTIATHENNYESIFSQYISSWLVNERLNRLNIMLDEYRFYYKLMENVFGYYKIGSRDKNV